MVGRTGGPVVADLEDIQACIDSVFDRVNVRIHAELTLLYWQVGRLLQRQEESTLRELAGQLSQEYGKVWNVSQLGYCLRAARTFSEEEMREAVSAQISWSHMRRLMSLEDASMRQYYARQCGVNGWTVSQLAERIDSRLFERSVGSRRPDELPNPQQVEMGRRSAPDLLAQDPLLVFLGIQSQTPQILREVERLLLDTPGFTFVARQKRLPIQHGLFVVELLLYHRSMRRLVVVSQGDQDMMELFLHWLDRHERQADEETPLGVMLGEGGPELLEVGEDGIRAPDYPAALPARELWRL
ncbi:DUF1016 family protein [bacterium]|nr:DUF1016 family protein [bacterium]